jgi:hypothetical protein
MNKVGCVKGSFFVFLRSFRADVETSEEWTLVQDGWFKDKTKRGNSKVILNSLLGPAGPLIEIGGNRVGLAHVVVKDDRWWEAALAYIVHATAIFINPDTTDSLARELRVVTDSHRLTRRTFIVMEPVHESLFRSISDNEKDIAVERINRWKLIRTKFADFGHILPEYRNRGAIISLFTGHYLSFVGLARYDLYSLMHETYVDLGKLGSYDIPPNEPCPCQSGSTFASCHARTQLPA